MSELPKRRVMADYVGLLSLPIFPAMTDGDVYDVVRAVTKVVEYFRR